MLSNVGVVLGEVVVLGPVAVGAFLLRRRMFGLYARERYPSPLSRVLPHDRNA